MVRHVIQSPLPIYFHFLKLFGGGMAGSPGCGFYKGYSSYSSKLKAGHLPVFKSGEGNCGRFMRYRNYQGTCSERYEVCAATVF
jgi:hypothetical protein